MKELSRSQYTPCTLVVCPAHIAKQWQSEVHKFSALQCVTLTNIKDWESTNMGMLCDPQTIVVLSVDLLSSATYQRHHYK